MLDIALDVPATLRAAGVRGSTLHLEGAPGPSPLAAFRVRQAEAALRERVKELEGLYAVSRLLADERRPTEASLRGVLALVPAAWQYPEITAARLEIGGEVYASPGFRDTPWVQSAPVRSGSQRLGRLDVAYLEERPAAGEGPFLAEERALLEALAQRIAEFVLRRRAEAERGASEAYFRALTETATDLVTVIDAGGIIRYQSESLRRVMGWPPEAIVGTDLFDLVHPDDEERVRDELAALAVRPDPDHRIEIRCLHADGSWRVLEAAGRSHLDNPAVRGIVVISRDTTARRAAEEALRASEERFAKLFHSSPLPICASRLDDEVVVEANQAFLEQFGLERDEVVGRPLLGLPLGIGREEHDRLLAALAERGEVRDLEVVVTPPGRPPEVHQLAAERIEIGGAPCLLVVGRDVTARKAAERALEHRAFHDPLTGLPNRSLFEEALEHALARAASRGDDLAVVFFDLDGFKEVNDTLGHDAGDELLRQAAGRLGAVLRGGDLLARFGGDEFCLLLDQVARPGEASAVVERLLRAFDEPFTVAGRAVGVRASAGVAYCHRGAGRPGELLRRADLAMYCAKGRHDGGWEMYDGELETPAPPAGRC